MLKFVSRLRSSAPRLIRGCGAPAQVFQPCANGKVKLTTDVVVVASDFEDYSLNSLISAGVDVSQGQSFETVDLNVHDAVDENVSRILDSEEVKVESKKTE